MIFTFFSTLKPYEEDNGVIEFYFTLCFDVIVEVIQFGGRRRLTKLEGVGRRFHHLYLYSTTAYSWDIIYLFDLIDKESFATFYRQVSSIFLYINQILFRANSAKH